MSAAMHTPGPWIVEDYFVFASNTLRIADCDCDEQDMPESEIEANTRLIAAAPAMYEALKAIQEKISGADVLFDPNPQWEGDQARYDAAQEALFSVDQALAQAEGK